MNRIGLIILSPLLIVLLVASNGLRINQHWCGDNMINASIWGKATPCEHFLDADKPACPHHASKKPKKCCNERETELQSNIDDFQLTAVQLDFEPELPAIPASIEVLNYTSVERSLRKFHNHSPPLIESVIYLLVLSLRL